MGYFDLPTGELELLLKKKGRGRHKEEWRSVSFTDSLTKEELVSDVENWSKNYKVNSARYNGKVVDIPTNYHWEHRYKDTIFGVYKTRDEVVAEMNKRKEFNWSEKDKTKKVPIGSPYFVMDL